MIRDPALHALAPEEVVPEKRRMTPARRRRILERFDNCCARLDCETAVHLEIDHIIPLELGGKDADENLEPLCRLHHLAKTARDIKLIGKARRIRKARTGQKRKAKTIPSRPFDKPQRKPAWPKGRGFQSSRKAAAIAIQSKEPS